MQAVRDSLYKKVQRGTYTIDELAKQYNMSQAAITLQINRLRMEGKPVKVTEDNYILFDESHPIWPVIFFTIVFGAMFLLWWIG